MQAQDGKKIGFGDLARELRDMVYANILEDDRPVRKWGTHKFSPRSAIVFVHRQINKEYNETMRTAEASIPCALHRHIYDDKAYSRQDGMLLSKQAFDDAVYVPNNATRVLTTIHINAGPFKSATVRNPRPRIFLTELEDLVLAVGHRLCNYTGLEHVVISIKLSNAFVVDFRRINITEFLYGAVKTIANRSRPQLQVLGVVLSGPVECFSRRAPDGGWVSDCGHGQKLMEVGDNRLDEALEDIRAPSDLLRAPKGFVPQNMVQPRASLLSPRGPTNCQRPKRSAFGFLQLDKSAVHRHGSIHRQISVCRTSPRSISRDKDQSQTSVVRHTSPLRTLPKEESQSPTTIPTRLFPKCGHCKQALSYTRV